MVQKTQTLRDRFEVWGVRRTLYWLVMQFLARYGGFHIHLVAIGSDRRDLQELEPKPEVPEGYQTRMVEPEELMPYVGVAQMSEEFLKGAQEDGDLCAATFLDDELVCLAFESRHRKPVTDQIDVDIPSGFVYGYKSWTHPDHRQKNLARRTGYEKLQFTLQSDVSDERGIWYVETHNYPSRLHTYRHPRDWAIRVGYVGWFTFFGRQIPFNTRWAKKVGFVFVRKEDNRPLLYD